MKPRVTESVISGHMTHSRTRLAKGTGHRPGYYYVEVLIWEGTEATGEPLGEWEMPKEYRYDHEGAARLAVAQQRFPAPGDSVDYVVTRRRLDGRQELLSGCDTRAHLMHVMALAKIASEEVVWLHVHSAEAGTPVTIAMVTRSMVFKAKNIISFDVGPVGLVVREVIEDVGTDRQ